MSDCYFNIALDNQRSLCISPLTRDELSPSGVRGNGLGYYLYERDESAEGVNVLAKIVSEDAARDLFEALRTLSSVSA